MSPKVRKVSIPNEKTRMKKVLLHYTYLFRDTKRCLRKFVRLVLPPQLRHARRHDQRTFLLNMDRGSEFLLFIKISTAYFGNKYFGNMFKAHFELLLSIIGFTLWIGYSLSIPKHLLVGEFHHSSCGPILGIATNLCKGIKNLTNSNDHRIINKQSTKYIITKIHSIFTGGGT